MPDIEIVLPRFERHPDAPQPSTPPTTPEAWEALKSLSVAEFRAKGFGLWSATSKLCLFPGEWYPHIPQGFPVTDIFGNEGTFSKAKDNETRMGCLAYGIVATKD